MAPAELKAKPGLFEAAGESSSDDDTHGGAASSGSGLGGVRSSVRRTCVVDHAARVRVTRGDVLLQLVHGIRVASVLLEARVKMTHQPRSAWAVTCMLWEPEHAKLSRYHYDAQVKHAKGM
jgi:hypothetical protein